MHSRAWSDIPSFLAEKVELVKNSFVNLSRNLSKTRDIHRWESLPLEEFLKNDNVAKAVRFHTNVY
jgi:hypothetical protein